VPVQKDLAVTFAGIRLYQNPAKVFFSVSLAAYLSLITAGTFLPNPDQYLSFRD
jgi:hypothetical protein